MGAPMDGWTMDGREEGREARGMRKRGKRQKRRKSQSAEKPVVSSSDRRGSLELGQRIPDLRKTRCWGQDAGRRGLGVGDTEGFPQTSCDLPAPPDLPRSILQAPRGLGG